MKKLLYLILLITSISFGQKTDALKICIEIQKSVKGFSFEKEADKVLDEILSVIGASKNFSLTQCSEINNALAITFKGERYILYDRAFINKINKMTNDWSGKFILAHEVGHHINGHTRDFLIASQIDKQTKEKQREEELEADEFAGFILAKLGASYGQISELIDVVASEKDDKYSTHPDKYKRLNAIKKGFDKVKWIKKTQTNISLKNNNDSNFIKTYEYSKYEKFFNWEYWEDYPNRRKKNPNYEGWSSEKIDKAFPIVSRTSSSIGKSTEDISKTIKIEIIQGKYKSRFEDSRKSNFDIKYFDKYDLDLRIYGLETAKYVNRVSYDRRSLGKYFEVFNKLTINFLNLANVEGKLQYTIDDKITGELIVNFNNWWIDFTYEKRRVQRDWQGLENLEIIDNPHYKKLVTPPYLEILWDFEDTSEAIVNNLKILKFLYALRNGNKLSLRLSSYRNDYGQYDLTLRAYPQSGWYFDSYIETTSYQFDLTGSSKALNFDLSKNSYLEEVFKDFNFDYR